jgi:hypothetical protein
MPTISHPNLFGGQRQPHPDQLRCLSCGTDRHLMIHSIDPPNPPRRGLVAVTYTCTRCQETQIRETSVNGVAAILNRPGPAPAADVLQFGGKYIHCGEPMHSAGTELRSIYSTVTTRTSAPDLLEVYLRTRVLRCNCGFQVEIPS